MSMLLRGLLKSPVSTISVENVQPESAGTIHHRPQHYSDQWDYSTNRHQVCRNEIKQEYGNDLNCIANVKMEQNISDEQFWKHFADEGKVAKVKQENLEEPIEGVYYTYTIPTGQQGWMDQVNMKQQHVSPSQRRSPHLDKNRLYFLGKEKSKRFGAMNVVTSLDTPSPQAYSPSGVPDFTHEGFIESCFGSGYGYEGPFSQFDDSLLSPPDSLGLSKLDSMMEGKGELSLEECGGIYSYNQIMEPEWLNEPISLHTPDEQEGDVTFTELTPYTSLTDVTLPITPASSHPPTPLSTTPNSDVEEVLSLFSDQNSNDSPSGYLLSDEYFPLGQSFDSFDSSGQFESSHEDSQYNSPCLTPISSPYPTPDSSYMVADDCSLPGPSYTADDRIAIKALLSKRDSCCSLDSSMSVETGRDRKRKTKGESSAPKPKRRLSLAAKKERKKEQNKTAALRYRQKKKEEKHGSFSKLDLLEEKNSELKKTVSSMTAEINYLKKLWTEINAAKTLKQSQQQMLCMH